MSINHSSLSPKNRSRSEFLAGLILFLFGILTIHESKKLQIGGLHAPGTGFFPFWLGCSIAILSLLLLIGLLVGKVEVNRVQWKELLWQKVVFLSVFLFAYSLTLESIGFIAGTFVLLGISFRLVEKKNILLLLGLSAFISAGTYFLFKYCLFIQLSRGIIPL